MNGITINDYGKFLVVLVALVGGIALAIVGLVVHDAAGLATGSSLATGALGYVFGNGRLASRTEPPATLFSPVLPEHEFVRKDDLEQLAELDSARGRVQTRIDDEGP
jgi:hypothetical protein